MQLSPPVLFTYFVLHARLSIFAGLEQAWTKKALTDFARGIVAAATCRTLRGRKRRQRPSRMRGRNVDEENSRTNGESESSVQWGIEMRDRASMTDDLVVSDGPPNHIPQQHHHHNHNQLKVVPNGQATLIGRRPSIRTKLKVTPDLQGATEVDNLRIASQPSPSHPPSSSHYQVPNRVCAVHGGSGQATASAISRRTVAEVNIVEESTPPSSSWSPGIVLGHKRYNNMIMDDLTKVN